MNKEYLLDDSKHKSALIEILKQYENKISILEHVIIAQKDIISDLLADLKTDPTLSFNLLTDLFCVDFPKRNERFEIVYNLLSIKINKRIIIKVLLKEEEELNSVTKVYRAANWYEREIFDLFGVKINLHPDLRRILTEYDFIGHPLRKDFPLYGYVEVKYDQLLNQIIHQPVALEEEFRNFNFKSPWNGPEDVEDSSNFPHLPGDEKATK